MKLLHLESHGSPLGPATQAPAPDCTYTATLAPSPRSRIVLPRTVLIVPRPGAGRLVSVGIPSP